MWHISCVTHHMSRVRWQVSLKDKPQIYFQARAWAKCLEILYPSLSTSLWLEVDKLQAWARALKNFRASLRASFLSYTVIVSLHFLLVYSKKEKNIEGFLYLKILKKINKSGNKMLEIMKFRAWLQALGLNLIQHESELLALSLKVEVQAFRAFKKLVHLWAVVCFSFMYGGGGC